MTLEDNQSLFYPVSLEEVRSVIFALDKDNVAGSDRFNGIFFQVC